VGAPTPAELQRAGRFTWDAFLDGAKRVTAAGGGTVLGLGSGIPGIRLWLNSNGVQEVDDLKFPTRSFYDDPRAVQAVEFWADTLLKHKVRDPEFGRGVQGGESTLLIDGKLGAMSRWTTGLSEFIKIQEFNWGMVPFPKGPQGTSPAGEFTFWGFTMAQGLKDERVKRGAWEWLKFYNGKEGQLLEGAKYLLSIPYDKTAMEEWRKRVASTKMEYPELIFELRDKYPNQRVMAPDRADINQLHDQALADVWTGQKSAREGCAEAARQVNEFLKQRPQKLA
jgi:ABC-type glycerol-3-phosphate transport system substrate-binding protein